MEIPLKPEGTGKRRHVASFWILIVVIIVVVLVASLSYFLFPPSTGHSITSSSSSSSTSQSGAQGIVTGYVTVGPSQSTCSANESSCTENLSGYSLEFTWQCPTTVSTGSASCQESTYSASIAPSGHYAILLAPGNYSITGLSPSCIWVGCASSFPEPVVVQPGEQLVVNINVDTGIS